MPHPDGTLNTTSVIPFGKEPYIWRFNFCNEKELC